MTELRRDTPRECVLGAQFKLDPNAVRCWAFGPTQIACLGIAPEKEGDPKKNWRIQYDPFDGLQLWAAYPGPLGRMGMCYDIYPLSTRKNSIPNIPPWAGYAADHSHKLSACFLPQGKAHVTRTADRITVVLTRTDNTAATANCGLRTLIPLNKVWVLGAACDSHSSVLHALSLHGPFHMAAEIGIRPVLIYDPNHPQYGEGNRNLLAYLLRHYGAECVNPKTGEVFLYRIIQRQLLDAPWEMFGRPQMIPNSSRIARGDIDPDWRYWASNRVTKPTHNTYNIVIVSVS